MLGCNEVVRLIKFMTYVYMFEHSNSWECTFTSPTECTYLSLILVPQVERLRSEGYKAE